MVVVPSFSKCQERYPPAITRIITGLESGFTPQVRCRIDVPRRMKSQCKAQKNSPQQYGPTAEDKEQHTHH
jgi:hypothetical protein